MSDNINLPTLYEVYRTPTVKSGLIANGSDFTLNNQPIQIYSGALHYFRVHPQYWRDRLRKLRAAGLNTIETYIPWNLHQPQPNLFDFGNGGTDFQNFLDIKKFIQIVREEDLLLIVRPGPYICAEWEFGGLPSWLLRHDNIKIRTSDQTFVDLVQVYFEKLFAVLDEFQFTKNGPIVAFQIENEYGNTKVDNEPIDTKYLETIKSIMESNGIVELLFTSDTPSNGFWGTLPNVLATANFQEDAEMELTLLKKFQLDRPLMVMEYWTGWFDHWSERHHTRSAEKFGQVLEDILKMNSSFNLYMFHGGTNWGFLNGANIKNLVSTNNSTFQPDTTSYDYDAPLSEAGDYTDKYYKLKEILEKYNNKNPKTRLPLMPALTKRVAYDPVPIYGTLDFHSIVETQLANSIKSVNVLPMEKLDINQSSGQSYGYITYRKAKLHIPANSVLKIEGHVCDTILVVINNRLINKVLECQEDLNGFGFWRLENSTINLGNESYENATLDLLVENYGRINYGKLNTFNQFKGLWQGDVLLNDKTLTNWELIPLEFDQTFIKNLDYLALTNLHGPALYKAQLQLNLSDIHDTYIDLRDWVKGFVVVNGFVLGRYFKLGPQQCLYLPAPLLKEGLNEIWIFEHFKADREVKFCTEPIFCKLN